MKKDKKYFIKYTIIDGSFEYGDNGLFKTNLEKGEDIEINFISSFWENVKYDEEEGYFKSDDDRILIIDSIIEVNNTDYTILKKYI